MNNTRLLTWLLKLLFLGTVVTASYRGAGDDAKRRSGRFLQQMNGDNAPADKNDVTTNASPVSPSVPTAVPSPIPVKAPLSPSSPTALIVVDLLPFVVSVNGGTTQSLTNTLKALLANEMQKEFGSFLSIGLRVMNGTTSGGTLDYSGTASFDALVGYQDVQTAQVRVLQDSASIQQYAPYVTSITMSNQTSHSSSAGLVVVVLVITIALGFAAYFGYRRYHKSKSLAPSIPVEGMDDPKLSVRKELPNPSDDFSQSVLSYDGPHTESDDGSLEDYSTTTDLEAGRMATTTTTTPSSSNRHPIPIYRATHGSSNMSDPDGSLDESSTTDSEAGRNSTQRYLAQRRQQRVFQQQQQQQVGSMSSQKSVLLYESDADCSYDYVVKRGMESDDDDLYTTDNETGEPGRGGGNFGLLGKGRDSDEEGDDFDDIDIPMTPNKAIPKSKHVKDLPFDEVSLASSCPNDEPRIPNVASAPAGTSTNDFNEGGDDDDEYTNGQKRSAGPTKSDGNHLGLSSFLRGRRKAVQAARQTQR